MSEYKIYNFFNTNPISFECARPEHIHKYGPLIYITQNASSLQFNHTITADQARQLAHILLKLAVEAEAIESDASIAKDANPEKAA